MRTSVLKSSSVDARPRSTAALESKHAPDLGIPEAALPQATGTSVRMANGHAVAAVTGHVVPDVPGARAPTNRTDGA